MECVYLHDAGGLHLTLSELHDIGVLLLLGDHAGVDCHVVLKSSNLTNEVHKLLFFQVQPAGNV